MPAATDILEIGFAAWLEALPAFSALAGARVYPQTCTEPAGPTYPLAVYRRASTRRPMHNKGGTGRPQATLELDCWGEPGESGYEQAKLLANAVRPHLEGWGDPGTLKWGQVTVTRCKVEDEFDVLDTQELSPLLLAQGVRFLLLVTWVEPVLTLPRAV